MINHRNDEMRDTKEAFDMLLQKASLKDYLKADPRQAGEKTELAHVMTSPFFFKYFYWSNEKVDKLIDEYKYQIEFEAKKNIVLHGYEGCGKTTFVDYWMNKEDNRHIVLEFDRYIRSGDELLATIIGNICKTLNKDVYEDNAIVVKKILEIFTTEHNLRSMAHNDVRNNFIYMFDKFKWLLNLINNGSKEQIDNYLLLDIKKFMVDNYKISELMLFMVIWDIAYKRVHELEDVCFFVFENMDTLYESVGLQNLVTEIGIFRNNAENLFLELKNNGVSICNPTKEYICIFVMRDTTKAVFNEHMNSQKVSLYIPKKSLTFNYRIDKVIQKKTRYLETLKEEKPEVFNDNCAKLLKGMYHIQEVLKDEYVTDTIFTLFNNNFRKEFEILADIHFDEDNIFESYKSLCDIDKECGNKFSWSRYGSRCVLFRNIFDLLNAEGFFDTLKRTDYERYANNKRYAVNLSRLILLYLQNSYNQVLPSKIDGRDWEFISIEILVKELLNICKDEKEIATALWEMYEFRTRNNWNHLVTFDQLHIISKETIMKQVQAIKKEDYTDIEFGKIRITLAGVTYIEKVLTHFEYFLARNNKTSLPSLFTWKVEDILNLNRLNNYLSLAKNEITQCCKRLFCFSDEVMSRIPDYKGKNFLDSKFAHRKYYEDGSYRGMYHCERIVHSQISYLDAFRMFVFYQIDHCSIIELNGFNISKMIVIISRYIKDNEEKVIDGQCKILKNIEDKEYIIDCIKENNAIKCISKSNGIYDRIELSDVDIKKYIKMAMNIKIISDISNYISMFGLKNEKERCTSTSEDTNFLVKCYDACIDEIVSNNYKKFNLEINQTNGKRILGEL